MSNEVWLVSFGETDDREMTVEEIASALEGGDITQQTIVWRDGMPAWLQIEKARELQAALGRLRPSPPRPHPSPARAPLPVPRGGNREKTIPGIARTGAAPAAPPERKRKVTSIGLGVGALQGAGTAGPKPYRRLDTPHPPMRRVLADPPPEFESDAEATPVPPPVAVRPEKKNDTKAAGASRKQGVVPANDEATEIMEVSTGELSMETLDSGLVQTLPDNPAPDSLQDAEVDSVPPSQTLAELAKESEEAADSSAHEADGADEIVDDVSADTPMFPSPPPMPAADADAEPISLDPVSMVAASAHLSGVPPAVSKEGPSDAKERKDAQDAAAPAADAEATVISKPVVPPEADSDRRGDSLFDELGVKDGPQSDIFAAGAAASAPLASEKPSKERSSSPLLFVAVGLVCVGAGYWFGTGATSEGGEPQPVAVVGTPTQVETAPEPTAAVVSQTQAAQPAATASSPAPSAEPPQPGAATAPTPAPASTHASAPRSTAPPAQKPSTKQVSGPAVAAPQPTAAASPQPATPSPTAPAPASPPSEADPNAPPFDKTAAAQGLGRAAAEASACRKDGDPSGVAKVSVTFSTSGRAVRATISGPPFAGTKTGGCIAAVLRRTRIPAFSGDRVTVLKTVVIH